MAKRNGRVQRAWRVAAPPTIVVAVVGALDWLIRWQFANRWQPSLPVVIGLSLVVFLTYFLFVLLGFKSSSPGVVDAPGIYAWPAVFVILLSVFGLLFYFV